MKNSKIVGAGLYILSFVLCFLGWFVLPLAVAKTLLGLLLIGFGTFIPSFAKYCWRDL